MVAAPVVALAAECADSADVPTWTELERRAARLARAMSAAARGRPMDAAIIIRGGRTVLDSYPPRS